jgi:hypothetical protein
MIHFILFLFMQNIWQLKLYNSSAMIFLVVWVHFDIPSDSIRFANRQKAVEKQKQKEKIEKKHNKTHCPKRNNIIFC